MTDRRSLMAWLAGALALPAWKGRAAQAATGDTMGSQPLVRKGYVNGPYGQIHYRTVGSGTPLLLCHQSPSSSLMYLPAMELFAARNIMAIAVDTPGYGMSDRPRRQPTIADYTRIIDPVLEHFGLESTHLLGHHTGANIACEYAHQNPHRVRTLTLGAPMVLTEEQMAARVARFSEPVTTPPVNRDGSHIMTIWQRRLGYTMGRDDLELANHHFCVTLAHWDNFFDGTNASINYDISPALSGLTMPTMILSGTADGQFGFTDTIKALRPDFRYVAVEDASGYIVDEKTEEWVAAIADFIA